MPPFPQVPSDTSLVVLAPCLHLFPLCSCVFQSALFLPLGFPLANCGEAFKTILVQCLQSQPLKKIFKENTHHVQTLF